jgi:hypothetical protein
MKRLLFILLLPLAFLSCSREVEEVPLYRQYAARQDLTVAQVKGFQLCDTVKTDVVILVADDSAAWTGLKEEFDIRTSEGVTSWMGNIEQPAQRVKRSVRPAWRAMAIHEERTIAFYRIDTEEQRQALLDYQMKAIENEQ